MKESTVPRMNPSLSRGISKIGSMVGPDPGKRGSMATRTRLLEYLQHRFSRGNVVHDDKLDRGNWLAKSSLSNPRRFKKIPSRHVDEVLSNG